MTKDELFEEMEEAVQEEVCSIDDATRKVTVAEKYKLLGVESDEKVKRIKFKCPKVVGDNIDLSKLRLYVHYRNSNKEEDSQLIEDVQTVGTEITFSWLLSRKVTKYKGNVQFIISAKKSQADGTLTNEWNTTLNKDCNVLEGLPIGKPGAEKPDKDIVEQLLNAINKKGDALKKEGNKLSLMSNGAEVSSVQLDITGGGSGTSNYTDLENKPQVNGVELSGNKTLDELGIQSKGNYALKSEIPTDNASLSNGAGYQKSDDVQSAINSAIKGITSFDYEKVESLPASGTKGKIYLVPNNLSLEKNIYDEYIWVDKSFEFIGNTRIDLSEYALKSEVPKVYDWAKQETKPTYTASEVGALSDTVDRLPNPKAIRFTGAVTETYDGSSEKVINIPTSSSGGGTSDYNGLINKPTINNVELNGNKTLEELGVQPKGEYLTTIPKSDANVLGGIKTKAKTNETVEVSSDESGKAYVPEYPTELKNPNAITFTGVSNAVYDGSSAVTVNIPESSVGSIVTDKTLTEADVAADAKAVGDRFVGNENAIKDLVGGEANESLSFKSGYGYINENLLNAENSVLLIEFEVTEATTDYRYVLTTSKSADSSYIQVGNGYIDIRLKNGKYKRTPLQLNKRNKIALSVGGTAIVNGEEITIEKGAAASDSFIIGVRRITSKSNQFSGKYYSIVIANTDDIEGLYNGTNESGITHRYEASTLTQEKWGDSVGSKDIVLYDQFEILKAHADGKVDKAIKDISSLTKRVDNLENGIDVGIVSANKELDNLINSSMAFNGFKDKSKEQKQYLTILHGSDFHSDATNFKRMMEFAKNYEAIDLVAVTGDTVLGTGWNDEFENTYGKYYKNAGKPCLNINGNHDVIIPANITEFKGFPNTPQGFADRYIKPYMEFNGCTQGTGAYYYKDYSKYKIRIIGLDEYEMPRISLGSSFKYDIDKRYISQAQADWLVSTLKSLEKGWSVIILMHQMVEELSEKKENKFCSPIVGNGKNYLSSQGGILQDIIDAFISKSALNKSYQNTIGADESEVPTVSINTTFSGTNGDFICYLSGHTHFDKIGTLKSTSNNQLNIVMNTSGTTKSNYDDLYRCKGKKSQDCLNLYVFDTDKKKVRIIRVGANTTLDMEYRDFTSVKYK